MEKQQQILQEDVADELTKWGIDNAQSFFARVRSRLNVEGVTIPTVTVEYNNLVYNTKASSSQQAIPGLASVVNKFFQVGCAWR